jgi:hypothetical protein
MLLCTSGTVNLIFVKCDVSDVRLTLIGHFDFTYVDRLQFFFYLLCQSGNN